MTASATPSNPSAAAAGNGLSQKAALFKKRLLGKTKTVVSRAPSLDRPRRPDSPKPQDPPSEAKEPTAFHMDSPLSWAILGAAIVTAVSGCSRVALFIKQERMSFEIKSK